MNIRLGVPEYIREFAILSDKDLLCVPNTNPLSKEKRRIEYFSNTLYSRKNILDIRVAKLDIAITGDYFSYFDIDFVFSDSLILEF